MDRVDLSLSLEQDQEAVYASNDEDGCGEMSERVSTLASSVYAEFERMIQKYGSGVVEQLMPMVINVLEQLESSYNENNEQAVEIELLAEDNEQLMTQYEREKQLKKLAETKYLEFEDSREQDKQELQTIIDQLELTCKQNENKIKSLQDQVERTEERLADQNREYDTLHTRHTEMLHAYMEKIEYQTKASTPATPDINSPYKRHTSVAQDLMSSSQTNLAMRKSELRSSSQLSMTAVHNEYIPGESRNDKSIDDECHADESEIESSTESAQVVSHLKRLTANIEAMNVDSEREIRVDSGVIESTQSEQFPAETYISGNLELSPEARAILQSTPELSSKTQSRIALEDTADESVYHTPGIDITAAQEYRQMSLQVEMQEGPKSAGSMYELNDQSGWKEMDHLLNENKELLDLKNKLQTQKNDLIRSVEELSNEKELQEEEISGLQATKTRMKLKISEQESALKKTRLEFEKSQIQLKNKMAEERISSANRKRFTRVEMAKVLMERNQYKERLMELQEAVRWTEMIRASKENHIAAIQQKKKSSIWKLFSNLFSTTTGSPTSTPSPKRSAAPAQPVNLWFNQTNQLADRRRSNAATTPTSSNTAVAYPSKYQADPGYEGLTERQRQERRERYKYVKEHIVSEGRHQAYGWSLPANYSGDQEGAMAVPVPVYCRPLNTEPAMKIWCAAGINLNGGRTLAGNFIGLPADFAEPSLSTVWIGTSTHSCSKVTIIDSNNPSIALDQFIVSSSHLLCMAAVDGLNDAEPKSENIVTGQQADKSTKPTGGSRHTSPEHSLSVLGIQAEEESFPDDVDGTPTFSSILPTMWLGAQSGKIYIHSAVGNWKKCLQSAKLKDSLLSIIYTQGRVLVALADGTVAIFHRKPDGRWDLSNYHLLDLGRPHHSIRCMAPVHDFVWCGYKNKIQVINPQTMKIEKAFDAHPRRESQVRQLACIADGVWVSIRLDSTLRLYNAHTFHHLQDVDIEPYVSKMLGTGKFGFSFVRITALLLTEDRLWVGTGNGIILSVPLVSARPLRENDEDDAALTELRSSTSSGALFMPYCAMVHAQLSFHGHRDSVKFFVAVPGSAANVEAAKAYSNAGARPPSPSNVGPAKNASDSSLLLMSGGEGYIDFRVGDDEQETNSGQVSNVERSHLLVWQVGQ